MSSFSSTVRRRWSEASMRSGRRRRRSRRVRASTWTRIDRRRLVYGRRPSSSTRGDARARPSTSRRDDDDDERA